MIAFVFATIVALVAILFYPIYKTRKKISEVAEQKWEEEDLTVYVEYGKHEIPILKSQVGKWEQMTNDEKWWMLSHLKEEVRGKRLIIEKVNGLTRFVGITEKAKDIKHRQKERTEAWKK